MPSPFPVRKTDAGEGDLFGKPGHPFFGVRLSSFLVSELGTTMDSSRRQWITGCAVGTFVGGTLSNELTTAHAADRLEKAPRVRYCLNTSTIQGQKLSILDEVEIAAKAGFDAIEPWLFELDRLEQSGTPLIDLKKRIADQGLTVESAIGFAEWIVDDPARRAKGLENAKRDMERLAKIGGKRIAAPPAGATDQADLSLVAAAERYRALVEAGESIGIIPQVEVWGFSKCLSRLGETVFVAVESGHPKALILPDIYHLYKGGSDFEGLRLLSGAAIEVFHVNDYPAAPPRNEVQDRHRVYPGLGIAPIEKALKTLFQNGFAGVLSLELFNESYWKEDPLSVAQRGLEAMKSSVAKAIA